MSSKNTITFGILTVSDRCFVNKAFDESGLALEKVLSESTILPDCRIEARSVVPDELDIIEKILKVWSDEKDIHVILTTGGTGFAPRDVTPEATKNVIEKEAPAMAMAIAKGSLDKTPMAMLSRAVCGIRKQTLIINLPGSKKGAVECLGFVIMCIPHAVALTRNWLNEVQRVHTIIQAGSTSIIVSQPKTVLGAEDKTKSGETTNISSCGHHKLSSKVDVIQVARRLRYSPYPMISYSESIAILDKVVSNIKTSCLKLSLRNALGYVLSENVLAEEDLPPFPASVKDGYAVKASDGKGVRKVIAASVAGSQPMNRPLLSGECVRINTGAPVPLGADSVVQVEDTILVTEDDDGRREVEIDISVAPKLGQDIRQVGSDMKKGDLIAQSNGIPLTSQDLGLFAAAGIKTVSVFRRPVIAVFSTGNELQEPGDDLQSGQVWDSNRLMLSSLFEEAGFKIVDLGIVRDEPNEMLEMMKAALNCSDIIVTTGSVSMGDKDMLKPILTSDLKAEIHFGRVNLKPGKPTTFASYKGEDGLSKLIFCLPGNPVSAYVTCHLYVLPAVKRLSGFSQCNLTTVKAKIQSSVGKTDDREEFKRGILKFTEHADFIVQVVGGCMLSSNLLSCQSSNCLVRIPSRTKTETINVNSYVECLLTASL